LRGARAVLEPLAGTMQEQTDSPARTRSARSSNRRSRVAIRNGTL
jgi:hypothetical protein